MFDWQSTTYAHVPSNASVSDQSNDGRYLLWYTTQGMERFDRMTGTSVLVAARPVSSDGTMSGDGRVVVFSSIRTDLVPGDTNGAPDYFTVDVLNGAIRRANVSATGAQAQPGDETLDAPSVDRRGRYMAFSSKAANLVPDDTNGFLDGFVADAARPMPTALTPSTLAHGAQHAVVTLAGGFLLNDATYDLGAGVTVESVTHRADGSQRLVVSVAADAPTGPHDVVVNLPGAMGTASGTCGGCLTVS